ncbi:MAG: hypothetical protein WD208_00370 [Dehalococcoidia bacterium]
MMSTLAKITLRRMDLRRINTTTLPLAGSTGAVATVKVGVTFKLSEEGTEDLLRSYEHRVMDKAGAMATEGLMMATSVISLRGFRAPAGDRFRVAIERFCQSVN